MRESTPPLSDLVRKIDRLRQQLESVSSPSAAGAIRNEIARLLQLAGANIADFQFTSRRSREIASVAAESGYAAIHPGQVHSPPPRAAEEAVSGGDVSSSARFDGAGCPALDDTYREPSDWEQYLMRVLGFDSLRRTEEWMNSPTDPAVLEKSGATQEEELDELLASIREIERLEDEDTTRTEISLTSGDLPTKTASLAEIFEVQGYRVNIMRDPYAVRPDEHPVLTKFLVSDHPRFIAKGPKGVTAAQVRAARIKWSKTHHLYGLCAEFHSGVEISLDSIGDLSGHSWQADQIGYVVIDKNRFQYRKPEEEAEWVVSIWHQYLAGDVYRYEIIDESGRLVASLGGFYSLEYCRQKATDLAAKGEYGRRSWYKSLSDWWARRKNKRRETAAMLFVLGAAVVIMIVLYLGAVSFLCTRIMLYLMPVILSGCMAYGSIWLLCILRKGAWKMLVDEDVRRSNTAGNILAWIACSGFVVVFTYFWIKTFFYWVMNF